MAGSHDSSTSYSLLRRLAHANDKEAWMQFYNVYFPMIFAWARRQNLTKEEAEDVAHDILFALVQLYRDAVEPTPSSERGGHYDPSRGRFRSWLRTVTHHAIIDYWKKKAKRREMPSGESTFLRVVDRVTSIDPNDISIRELDRVVIHIKVRSAMDEFIEWLRDNSRNPERDIAVARIALIEGESGGKRESVPGLEPGHVRVVACRLRKQMRDLFPELAELVSDQ